jgi:hypothetical protein
MESNLVEANDLAAAWRSAAAAGEIGQEFVAAADDPAGRWIRGERVRFGVAWSPDRRETAFAAVNLTTGSAIPARVVERPVGEFGLRCQYNSFRALRPGKATARSYQAANIPEDPAAHCRFYCQDDAVPLSLLRRSSLARLELPNSPWNAYPNAAPLHRDGHLLWIPVAAAEDGRTRIPHRPQRLTAGDLEDLIALAARPANRDFLLFYNAMGAGATVDHLHIQALMRTAPLPIERAGVGEHKGCMILADYPAGGFVFGLEEEDSISALGKWVARLQDGEVPFNLILAGGRAFLVPRAAGVEAVAEMPGSYVASIEMAGTFITGDPAVFDRVDETTLRAIMGRVTLCPKTLIDRWG